MAEKTLSLETPELPDAAAQEAVIDITGARVHNLKNIDVRIPRYQLVVVTGVSGSGKSSLAFDTLYAEGQRRYLETFSGYVRQFLGNMERPDVDKIDGLSPVIAIDQKTTTRNPRSTVGTVTEIYDFLRLLYARAADAYSYETGNKMEPLSEEEMLQRIRQAYEGQKITILASKIKGRKGHYREDLDKIRKKGYTKARIDGEITELYEGLALDRYKLHDIEVVIDRLPVQDKHLARLTRSIQTALNEGRGALQILADGKAQPRWFTRTLMDPETGLSYDEPDPNNFSFNSPYGACPTCNGMGYTLEADEEQLIPRPDLSIRRGAIALFEDAKGEKLQKDLQMLALREGFKLNTPFQDLSKGVQRIILYGDPEFDISRVHDEFQRDSLFYLDTFMGLTNYIRLRYQRVKAEGVRNWLGEFIQETPCTSCNGTRLKKESRYFYIADQNIADLAHKNLDNLYQWFSGIEEQLSDRQKIIAEELIKEIQQRIGFLLEVGLGYLALARPARSLSGGEAQRIRLATQIGSQLQGVLYILDEPSIGLHARDQHRLINSLKQLRDLGNSIIVVEHDRDTMEASDHLLDIGPGAGDHGGKIVAQGTPDEVRQQDSLTAEYLAGTQSIPVPTERRASGQTRLEILGAEGHNLQKVDLDLPLGNFVCVTGVSGSGKSSLINQTVYPILHKHAFRHRKSVLPYEEVRGLAYIDKVVNIDQRPIGRTPRSNPATYTGLFTEIRQLFAELPESQIRGYKPGRFSFNVKGGRCETCKGAGVQVIEMNFLPDVHVTCPTCRGRRYNRETLEIRYKGKSINDVLEMTVEDAVDFFQALPRIRDKLNTLNDVGLGYIRLGQAATTLSGGEAQRMKLATELSKKGTGKTVYILDEPTTGLHFRDIAYLIEVLNRLVDKGNTVIVIEHDMDIIKVADHVIDMGPEGGEDGGEIVATGTPEAIAEHEGSYTGQYLQQVLNTTRSSTSTQLSAK